MLALLSLTPTLGLAVRRGCRAGRQRAGHPLSVPRRTEATEPPTTPWPVRPRSLASLVTLQLGVCLMMLCASPWLLSSAFGAFKAVSAHMAAFTPLGALCAMLALRSDDPVGRVRLVRQRRQPTEEVLEAHAEDVALVHALKDAEAALAQAHVDLNVRAAACRRQELRRAPRTLQVGAPDRVEAHARLRKGSSRACCLRLAFGREERVGATLPLAQ